MDKIKDDVILSKLHPSFFRVAYGLWKTFFMQMIWSDDN